MFSKYSLDNKNAFKTDNSLNITWKKENLSE